MENNILIQFQMCHCMRKVGHTPRSVGSLRYRDLLHLGRVEICRHHLYAVGRRIRVKIIIYLFVYIQYLYLFKSLHLYLHPG